MSEKPSQNQAVNLSPIIDEASQMIGGTNGKLALKKGVNDSQISALLSNLLLAISSDGSVSYDSNQIEIICGMLKTLTGVDRSGQEFSSYVRGLAHFYTVGDTRSKVKSNVGGASAGRGFGVYSVPKDTDARLDS